MVQKGKTDAGRRLEGTRVSPLMDNDSPESQIKAWTTVSIMLKPPQGFCQWKQRRKRLERLREEVKDIVDFNEHKAAMSQIIHSSPTSL